MKDTFFSIFLANKLYSILYRVVLTIYAVYILFTSTNHFDPAIYFTCIILYFVVFFYYIIADDNFSPQIRLVNDYALITLVLFGKSIVDINSFVLFILPLINTANYTGKKSNLAFVYAVIIISLMIVSFGCEYYFTELEKILPIIALLAITTFVIRRKRAELVANEQFSSIEDSLNNLTTFPNSYELYAPLLEGIHKLQYFNCDFETYKAIACFGISKRKGAYLINSSDFIYDFEITDNKKWDRFIKPNNDFDFIQLKIKINGKEYNKSLVIKVNAENKMLFVFFNNQPKPPVFKNIHLYEVLKPTLERLAKIIEFEQLYKRHTKNNLRTIKNKFFYVRNAEKAMHFIRNKLSPLDNVLEILNRELNDKEAVLFSDSKIESLIKDELEKSTKNLKKIVQRAGTILKKTNNPFNVADLNTFNPTTIFALISELIWDNSALENSKTSFQWDTKKLNKYNVKYNEEGLYFLLTDWISNMEKHGKNHEILYQEEDQSYILVFSNTYIPDFKDEIQKAVNDFNTNDRIEILRRKSHGIYQIKTSIEEMQLSSFMELDNERIYFTLKFKKHEK